MVHRVENSYNLAKDIIKNRRWQNSLAETYEMITERNTLEVPVLLDAVDYLARCRLGLENREYARLDTVEHSCVDEVGGNGGETHIALHLLELYTHTVAPAYDSPLACRIDRHTGVGNHSGSRCYVAYMAVVALNHSGEELPGNYHGSNRVYLHRALDVACTLLVESVVVGNNACTVDEDIYITALFCCHFCNFGNLIAVRYIHFVAYRLANLVVRFYCRSNVFLVDIPYNQAARTFFKCHTAHYAANS